MDFVGAENFSRQKQKSLNQEAKVGWMGVWWEQCNFACVDTWKIQSNYTNMAQPIITTVAALYIVLLSKLCLSWQNSQGKRNKLTKISIILNSPWPHHRDKKKSIVILVIVSDYDLQQSQNKIPYYSI